MRITIKESEKKEVKPKELTKKEKETWCFSNKGAVFVNNRNDKAIMKLAEREPYMLIQAGYHEYVLCGLSNGHRYFDVMNEEKMYDSIHNKLSDVRWTKIGTIDEIIINPEKE